MTAVLPRPLPVPAPTPTAPRRGAYPTEPVDRRTRYWDVATASWRPSPTAG